MSSHIDPMLAAYQKRVSDTLEKLQSGVGLDTFFALSIGLGNMPIFNVERGEGSHGNNFLSAVGTGCSLEIVTGGGEVAASGTERAGESDDDGGVPPEFHEKLDDSLSANTMKRSTRSTTKTFVPETTGVVNQPKRKETKSSHQCTPYTAEHD